MANSLHPQDCSTPCSSVLHYLPEFAQIHIHWVSDVTQSSQPLSPPSALNLSQPQGLFQWVSFSHQVAKLLELQLHLYFSEIPQKCWAIDGILHCLPRLLLLMLQLFFIYIFVISLGSNEDTFQVTSQSKILLMSFSHVWFSIQRAAPCTVLFSFLQGRASTNTVKNCSRRGHMVNRNRMAQYKS